MVIRRQKGKGYKSKMAQVKESKCVKRVEMVLRVEGKREKGSEAKGKG